MPEVAAKSKHLSHGMLRLPTGKMSSRTGDVVTAESLIEQVKNHIRQMTSEISTLSAEETEANTEDIAIGAIKYSILRQSPGHDIVFDFDKSISLEGESGPYIQYAYARLNNILSKAGDKPSDKIDYSHLIHDAELNLIRELLDFPEIISDSIQKLNPSPLARYIYHLATLSNNFYEKVRVLQDDNQDRISAKLSLIDTTAKVIARGLNVLGIKALARI